MVGLFEKYSVLTERELHARYEVMLETYNKTVNVEGQLMVLMANRYILPAAFRYQKQVGESVVAVKAAGGESVEGKKTLDALVQPDRRVQAAHRQAGGRRSSTRATAPPEKHARHFRDAVDAGDGGAAGNRRRDRAGDPARAVAAGDLSRDAVHQVVRRVHECSVPAVPVLKCWTPV